MKIALLQCNSVTGDVAGNTERILEAARQAATAGAELALCGVPPGPYLCAEDFAGGCRRALDRLAAALAQGPALLVGAPVPSVYASGLLSNAAVLVHKGGWQVVSRKVYQNQGQNQGQAPGAAQYQDEDARYFDRGISCGIVTLGGWRLGVVLCEDALSEENAFWKTRYASGHNPLMELVQRGVDAIVHMAASTFCVGAQEAGEHMLSHVAARHHVHLFSVNLVGGNDSRVYNGQSLGFDPTGQLLARGKAFAEDVLVVDPASNQNGGKTPEPLCACEEEACWRALVLGTGDFVRKCGLEKAIVAKVDENRRPIPGTEMEFDVDTILLSVGLIPENELTRQAGIPMDPHTKGAVVYENMETGIPGVFACGNVVHVHDLVDFVSGESDRAGAAAAAYVLHGETPDAAVLDLVPGNGVGYTVPQRVRPADVDKGVEISFRVRQNYGPSQITITCGEKQLARFKRQRMAPGEMEHITLPGALLAKADGPLNVAVEEVVAK